MPGTLDQFLGGVRNVVRSANGVELRNWLRIGADSPGIYFELAQELKAAQHNDAALQNKIDLALPEEDDVREGQGSPWPGLNSFMKEYLIFWREANFNDLILLHAKTSDLLVSCANALANPTYGAMLLQTSIAISETLAKLVMVLNRRPELMSRIRTESAEDEGETKSIAEVAADIIQKIFTSCLTDRSSTRWTEPKGKKVAVYTFANLTLKLLFACDKSRLAVQMFTNLSAFGPALSLYPASQRVTFLYYLGRFNFDHKHYYRAHLCFEEAYRQCPRQFLIHRRRVLEYWIPSNLLLARFPSQALLQRPEATGFADIFLPLCAAVRTGNFVAFHAAMKDQRQWLWQKKVYLPLLYSLRPLVWRSFTRKTFILTHNFANGDAGNKSPLLDLKDVVTTAAYVQKLLEGYVRTKATRPQQPNALLMQAVTNSASDSASALVPPPGGRKKLMPSEGLIFGNMKIDLKAIEGVVAPLVYAGLLNGFISHASHVFAVEGTKRKGGNPVAAGWPNPYESIMERFKESWEEAKAQYESGESSEAPGELDDVPAWVRGP
ncbi:hypothetical protein GQ53DRAFT_744841 [Thozetella sp. PMI_491]|nr:hypothetical protein GQ53DRAFT_744841 [Thozetella sp. PMI_491]